jgi:hypothetical protein
LIAAHGGYRELKSYQNSEIVYDGTVEFCDRFVDHRSRTRDQMVQAARSGKQNIAEESMANQPNELSARSTTPPVGATVSKRRRVYGAPLPHPRDARKRRG